MNQSSASGNPKLTSGTTHWLIQRVSAFLLIPLTYPLIGFLGAWLHAPYQETITRTANPVNLIALAAWFVIASYHAALGMQVIIEDYVGDRDLQSMLLKLVKTSLFVLAATALYLVYRLA